MIIEPKKVIILSDSNDKKPFKEWLESLNKTTRARINNRILRLSLGNYGDYKFLGNEIFELRIHFGAGYRVYFGEDKENIILLINGGDKSTQQKDINKAVKLWAKYQENRNER
jgi:putative addiction module killer protein